MELAEVLEDYGRRHGIERLALGRDHRCELLLDGAWRLILDHRLDVGILFLRLPIELPALSPAAQAALYRRLLEANLPGGRSAGAVFSLDQDEVRLELHRRLLVRDGLEPRQLAGAIDALYGALSELVGELGLRPEPDLPDGGDHDPEDGPDLKDR
jgi:hypothetical protein